MKKFRKLIPALCMLLVSALFVGTSTYAWFSMNTTVTAANMQITAKSDTTYLLISDDKTTADEIQEQSKTKLTWADSKELYPAALKESTTNPFTDADDNWWYAQALAKTAATKKDDTVVKFGEAKSNKTGAVVEDTETFGQRVLKKTVYLTLSDGSTASTALNVKFDTFTDSIGDKNATKIVVATENKALYFDKTNATIAQQLADAGTLTDTSVLTVKIFVYFDGENADVYTDNIANLQNATAGINFSLA